MGTTVWLALLLWSAGAAAQWADAYSLPPSKKNIEACRTAALALRPGNVETFQLVWQQNGYWFRFDIRAQNGETWRVFCDGATARSLRVKPDRPMAVY